MNSFWKNFWKGFAITGGAVLIVNIGKGIYDACHLSTEDEKMVKESVESLFDQVNDDMTRKAEEKFRKAANL